MTQEEKNRQDPEVAEYCERKEIKRKYVNISYANRTDYEKLDIYLPDYNCIIETNGMQHYNHNNNKIFNSDKIKQNDEEKKRIAIKNGITNYYVIDCRYSEIEYIKNSIQKNEVQHDF